MADNRLLVDEMLAVEKEFAAFGQWSRDVNGVARFTRAIAYRGEVIAELCLKAYPRRTQPSFRISLIFADMAVWRIDFTYEDKPHINSFNRPDDMPLGPIRSPHYHSWSDNRRFATQSQLPRRLQNARLMPETVRTFEQAFWWFCSETRIKNATGDVPELPRRDTLL